MKNFYALIELIKGAINQSQVTINWDVDCSALAELAKRHRVMSIAYHGLAKSNLNMPEEIADEFANQRNLAIKSFMTQDYEMSKIISAFEENGIKNVQLKGSSIRSMYPSPDMRVSCDVDIHYRRDDFELASKILTDMGYTFDHSSVKDDVFTKPFSTVELHNSLVGDSERFDAQKDIWDKALLTEGKKFSYKLTFEDNYIFNVTHSAKHFFSSGIGIRAVLDTWMFMKNFPEDANVKYINEALESVGLLKFRDEFEQLARVWFEDAPKTKLSEIMTSYIIKSGNFGSKVNEFALKFEKKGSNKFVYYFRRLFPNLEEMKLRYDILHKYPVLLPFTYIARFIGLITNRRSFKNEINILSNMQSDSTEDVTYMKNVFGIE